MDEVGLTFDVSEANLTPAEELEVMYGITTVDQVNRAIETCTEDIGDIVRLAIKADICADYTIPMKYARQWNHHLYCEIKEFITCHTA